MSYVCVCARVYTLKIYVYLHKYILVLWCGGNCVSFILFYVLFFSLISPQSHVAVCNAHLRIDIMFWSEPMIYRSKIRFNPFDLSPRCITFPIILHSQKSFLFQTTCYVHHMFWQPRWWIVWNVKKLLAFKMYSFNISFWVLCSLHFDLGCLSNYIISIRTIMIFPSKYDSFILSSRR